VPDGYGGSWNNDNVILYTRDATSEIFRVPAAGGEPASATVLDKTRQDVAHSWPRFLPDGRHFLFFVRSAQPQNSGLYIASLDSKQTLRVPGIDTSAVYAPPGFLLFVRDRKLMAQPFDINEFHTRGDAVPIAVNVEYIPAWEQTGFSVSQTGVLAYAQNNLPFGQLVLFDRTGKEIRKIGEPAQYWDAPHASPDGKHIAIGRLDADGRNSDIWLFDVARGVGWPLTSAPSWEQDPVWAPDSSAVIFTSNREGVDALYRRSVVSTAVEQLVVKSKFDSNASDWSRDGKYLLYNTTNPETKHDVWLKRIVPDEQPVPLLNGPSDEAHARFSPDGRWLAYQSNETGKVQVYVRSFPITAAKWQISINGGYVPVWGRDGRELFFMSPGGKTHVAKIAFEPSFDAGIPTQIPNPPQVTGAFDVTRTPDGERFVAQVPVPQSSPSPITVVLNWTAELQKK